MGDSIVTVTVTQQIAPTPSTLQGTGALVSQGGTTLSPGAHSLLTQFSSLTPLLAASLALTTLAWSSNVVTATATTAHGITVGDQFLTTISGAVPVGYNGTFLATVTTSTEFTYELLSNPGSETTPGTYSPRNVAELVAEATTFFSQGASQGVYVLELGAGEVNAGVTALTNFIEASPQFFYSYLVPRSWDGNADFLAMLADFESTTSKTYFFVTTTLATWDLYSALMKCVVTLIEAPAYGTWAANTLTALTYSDGEVTATTTTAHGVLPGQWFQIVGCTPAGYNGWWLALPGTTGETLIYAVPAALGEESALGSLVASTVASTGVTPTEFSHASDYYVGLNYKPSTTNKVTPFAFSFLFGVTPFPIVGNQALLTTLKAGAINTVGTGAEGGINDAILTWGTTMDARQFTYWYSVDWMQINGQLAVANAVINGSNDPVNPLYYSQSGINSLQDVLVSTVSSAITFGLALSNGPVVSSALDGPALDQAISAGTFNGQLVVNAVPFINYVAENPSDYKTGTYNGLSVQYITQNGFIAIGFNIVVTDFVAQTA